MVGESGKTMETKLKSGIYSITNRINKKKYIGQSVDVEKRLYAHKLSLVSGTHVNFHLQKAIHKYGMENFSFEIIEYSKVEDLSSREIYWINYYNSVKNGYNVLLGGKQEYSKKRMFSENGFPPQFLIRYLYDGYCEMAIFYCQVVFGSSVEDLISKKNKKYSEKVFIKKYLDKKLKFEDLLSGNFEKYKDKRRLNKLFDERLFTDKDPSTMSNTEFKILYYLKDKKNKK